MGNIYVYPQGTRVEEEDYDYTSFGLVGALVPTSCIFREVANGESSIEMSHPLDEWGRYEALEKGCILVVPVPVRQTPEINEQGKIRTLVYKYVVKDLSSLPDSRRYRTIYKTRKVETDGGTTTESIKGKMKVLDEGDKVTVLQIPEDSIYVKVSYGNIKGWMYEESLDYQETITLPDNANNLESIEPPWHVIPQLFRIYESEKTLTEVKVKARHISYDLLHNMTLYSTESRANLIDVVNGILTKSFEVNPFSAHTNVSTSRVGISYKYKNPIDAFFDPEEGVTTKFQVSCIRNNYDLYFLADPGINRGVRLTYGKNLTGINFKASDENVITRIVPVGQNEDGTDLYLDDYSGGAPTSGMWVDVGEYDPSYEHAYNFVHVYELSYSDHKVGDVAEDGDTVYVRKTKSNSGIILATVNAGDEYDYGGEHDKAKGFYSIKITINGWVKVAHAKTIQEDGDKVEITTATSVYKSNDDSSDVFVDQVEVGKKYTYVQTLDNYYEIEIEVTGYVNDAYSKYNKSKGSKTDDGWVPVSDSELIDNNTHVKINNKNGSKVYKDKSTESKSLGTLQKGDILVYDNKEESSFYKVKYTHTTTLKKIEILGVVYSVDDIRAQMRDAALEMFENNVHLPEVSLDVQFQNLGDTEEYAAFRGLEDLYLYDYCIVEYPKQNINLTARIVEIEWDCMLDRMKSVKIGSVGTTMANMTIGTWQIPTGFSGTKIGMGTLPGAAIQNGSIDGLQIRDGALSVDKLIADEVETQMLTAVRANIHDLVADKITTDELYADLATIGKMVVQEAEIDTAQIRELNAEVAHITEEWVKTEHVEWDYIDNAFINSAQIEWASITSADIDEADIDWAHVETLEVSNAQIDWATITEADINKANIEWAEVNTLSANYATIVDGRINNAKIDYADITDLDVGTMSAITAKAEVGEFDRITVRQILSNLLTVTEDATMTGMVYIENLTVTSASILSATFHELTLKSASDGKYYNLTIDPEGNIKTKNVTVTQSEIDAGVTSLGTRIVETSINVQELTGHSIHGESANIASIVTDSLNAGKIEVLEILKAPYAEIPELKTVVLSALKDTLIIRADNVLMEVGQEEVSLSDKLESVDHYSEALNDSIKKASDSWQSALDGFDIADYKDMITKVEYLFGEEGIKGIKSRELVKPTGESITWNDYINFDLSDQGDPKLIIGSFTDTDNVNPNLMKMQLSTSKLSFMRGTNELAYFSDEKLYVNQMQASEKLSIGKGGNGFLDMVSTATGVGFIWRTGS